jgi:hypothetical protein
MFARVTEVAEHSLVIAEMMRGPDAAQKVLRFFGAVE